MGIASKKSVSRWTSWLTKNMLLLMTMAGIVMGVIIGGVLRTADPSPDVIRYVGFPGELFMNMLKAMVLPLIAASIVSGLSQLDGKTSGRLGSRAVMYYAITTTHAVILGIIVVSIIQPGDPTIKQKMGYDKEGEAANVSAAQKFLDLFRNAFPENIMRATFSQVQTNYINQTHSNGATHEVLHTGYVDGMNVLGIIVFCIVMGLVVSRIGEEAKALANLFHALDVVITRMVMLIMWLGPIGIPSLIAQKMLEVSDLWLTARMLGLFVFTVILGLAIQAFITLPLIYFIGTRHNPYTFLKGLGQAIMTALGTSSSAASLPVTFRCLNKLGIDPRVTKFVLPVGAMVNMDGTALYEATASIFIAQMNGLELSIGQIVTVSITATLASIGAASIPSAGLVTMLIVLTALGLPANDISLILAVDWFLDRLRTSVNVIGDALGCGFVHHICADHLNADVAEAEKNHAVVEAHGVNFDELEKECEQENNNQKQIEQV
ncbi:Amino acid transporter [Caenorhabditis elegans]|uniref:Amino acid transporter n=1 Tax=Caenorhabditis elegans TaxID=6239 RepID=O18210_CAEEL|nr:Amino acid transporter [Caenorhabditis elegans]CAB16485.1 Amino acid transporter [Caenorhabditis elegans]|eukprot:NP_496094.1 Amino acid transporter [Caenorhabditis elegans]